MARRKDSERKVQALLENIRIENLIERRAAEGSLEGELEEELGYTRYNYRQKDTDNSRNGYSKYCILAEEL